MEEYMMSRGAHGVFICEDTMVPLTKALVPHALSWSLSEANSMKVADLGRNRHRLTCWRTFWWAMTGPLLFILYVSWGHTAHTVLVDTANFLAILKEAHYWRYFSRVQAAGEGSGTLQATKDDEREPVCIQHLCHQSLKLLCLSHVHSSR